MSTSKVTRHCDSPISVRNSTNNVKRGKSRDQKMHKLIFEDGGLREGTEVCYISDGKKLRVGQKMGWGIKCYCCDSLVSPSQFETHAGWAERRKPYMYIYTSYGMALHEFALSLQQHKNKPSKEPPTLCAICGNIGRLVTCNGCSQSFHKVCASLSSNPLGEWYCMHCSNSSHGGRYEQRVDIDSEEQKTNCCSQILDILDDGELIACVICRAKDFMKSGFGPRTVIVCDQCEKEYHIGCLKKLEICDLKQLPKGKWFCSKDCQGMHSYLENLIRMRAQKLPDSSLDITKRKLGENAIFSDVYLNVRWRLLKGKSPHTTRFLQSAVAILHRCFSPIVDPQSNHDLVPALVFGRKVRGQDFSGMNCALLTVNSKIVSVAVFRILGHEIAELPLAATNPKYQGKQPTLQRIYG